MMVSFRKDAKKKKNIKKGRGEKKTVRKNNKTIDQKKISQKLGTHLSKTLEMPYV